MTFSFRWLWPAACVTAMVVAGCGSPPPNDQTDPLPNVFHNEDVDLSNIGPGSGTGMGGGMGGGMGMGRGGGGRHGTGSQDGTGGGNMDGTGGGHQKAKTKKAAREPAGESKSLEAEKTDQPASSEPKKSDPSDPATDSGKQATKERSEKDEP